MTRVARVMLIAGVALVAVGAPAPVHAVRVAGRGAPTITQMACDATGAGCAVGATGPTGGVVFYDAGSPQWWGRYLEAWPTTLKVQAGVPWSMQTDSIYAGDVAVRRVSQRQAMAIGMGRANTAAMVAAGAQLAVYFASVTSASSADWYLPSKDELDALYNAWRSGRVAGLWKGVPVWTSTESEDAYAWYQLFQDGTQFTDANGILSKYPSNKTALESPRHAGSDFAPAAMHIVPVRAFGPTAGTLVPTPLVTSPRAGGACATTATGCAVGDVGPAGGIVVYDAGSDQAWGRYLEVAPKSCEHSGLPWASATVAPSLDAAGRIRGKSIGAGAGNTRRIAAHAAMAATRRTGPSPVVSPGAGRPRPIPSLRSSLPFSSAAVQASAPCAGYADWFLPSKDELNEACRVLSHSRKDRELTPAGGFDRGYYWTSSDYNGRTAWSQYFADCQQFDRVQTLTRNAGGQQRPFLIRAMRAFATGQVSSGPPTYVRP